MSGIWIDNDSDRAYITGPFHTSYDHGSIKKAMEGRLLKKEKVKKTKKCRAYLKRQHNRNSSHLSRFLRNQSRKTGDKESIQIDGYL